MIIDFVVTWLDANDPQWVASYQKYRGFEHVEDKGRFRNWDTFRYWFRSVEKYAPWVNKIYLVTNGKTPDWINANHPKLVMVNHTDFIPHKFLPTFNSCAIELNFHRIKNLSEHFVYFNDDSFLNNPVGPEYYFKDGLPCDNNSERYAITPLYTPEGKFSNRLQVYCDIALINKNFDRRNVIRQDRWKWFGPHLWGRSFLVNIIQHRKKDFNAFNLRHFEQPMLKSVIREIWDNEIYLTDLTCSQFRQDISLNPYIIRYWQFATNRFCPMKENYGKYFALGVDDIDVICCALMNKKYQSLCLNDSPACSDEVFIKQSKLLHSAFERKFPQKSLYEI